MERVIEPTDDAGYMVGNRIELVLASPGASIYGQINYATTDGNFRVYPDGWKQQVRDNATTSINGVYRSLE